MSFVLKFQVGDPIVYFSHGVGEVVDIEDINSNGIKCTLYVIHFAHEKMVLKVPVSSPSIRAICSRDIIERALETIKQKAKRTSVLWSKKMAMYETKVNSGDPIALAEVVRDIYRNIRTADYSFTERSVFENALKRISSELSYVDDIPFDKANEKIKALLETAGA